MSLQHTIKAIIRRGERLYVAECVEIAVVTQGRPWTKPWRTFRRLWAFIWKARIRPLSA